jgi:hypothetical protein
MVAVMSCSDHSDSHGIVVGATDGAGPVPDGPVRVGAITRGGKSFDDGRRISVELLLVKCVGADGVTKSMVKSAVEHE